MAHPPERFGDYELGKVISKSGASSVYSCRHVLWDEQFAVKCFGKSFCSGEGSDNGRGRAMSDDVKAELAVMKAVEGNRHCLGSVEVYDEAEFVMAVVPFAGKGDLFDCVFPSREEQDGNSESRMDFSEAMAIFVQVLMGVDHLHHHMYIHGDVKLENILLDDSKSPIIADFGHAQRFRPGKKAVFFCGTLHYCAPETILRIPVEGPEVDVWSLGVVLYILLHGRYPFYGPDELSVLRAICQASYAVDRTLSGDVQLMLHGMLQKDPRKRLSVWQVKQHPAMRSLYDSYVNFLFKEESVIRQSSDEYLAATTRAVSDKRDNRLNSPSMESSRLSMPLLPILEIEALNRGGSESLSPRVLYSRRAVTTITSPRDSSTAVPAGKGKSPVNRSVRVRCSEPDSPRIQYSRKARVPPIQLTGHVLKKSPRLSQMPVSQLSPCNRDGRFACEDSPSPRATTPRSPKINLETLLSPHVVSQLVQEFGINYATDNLTEMARQAARRSTEAKHPTSPSPRDHRVSSPVLIGEAEGQLANCKAGSPLMTSTTPCV